MSGLGSELGKSALVDEQFYNDFDDDYDDADVSAGPKAMETG